MHTLTEKDIEGLPSELISQLTTPAKVDTEGKAIVAALESMGEASIDRLLIRLYRDTGKIFQRRATTMKLYRMIDKGQLVRPKRGVYRVRQIKPEVDT